MSTDPVIIELREGYIDENNQGTLIASAAVVVVEGDIVEGVGLWDYGMVGFLETDPDDDSVREITQ